MGLTLLRNQSFVDLQFFYYTVPASPSTRKSTIDAIAAICFFYILTLYMGLSAMVNGALNPAKVTDKQKVLAGSYL